jgi:L-lactate dehydrogenase (cytochrome)
MVQSEGRVFSGKDVARHNSRESCWIIVHGARSLLHYKLPTTERYSSGKVYDVTDFLDGVYYY